MPAVRGTRVEGSSLIRVSSLAGRNLLHEASIRSNSCRVAAILSSVRAVTSTIVPIAGKMIRLTTRNSSRAQTPPEAERPPL